MINRQDAINTALEFFVEFLGGAFHEDDQRKLIAIYEQLPSVQPDKDLIHLQKEQAYMQGYEDGRKSRKGKWIRNFDGNEWYWFCSNCKEEWYEEDLWMGGNDFPNFCPNCGCQMNGGEQE